MNNKESLVLIEAEGQGIEKTSKLHWYHWFIILASTCLTLYASYITKQQSENKAYEIFQDQAEKVVEQVQERMSKYEMALYSGVSIIKAHDNAMNYLDWKKYSNSFKIEEKYPGINGIGVIYYVSQDKLESYLKRERKDRPNYKIHPPHQENQYWPITYIEPEHENLKAVGLDMAHEENRYLAIKKARDNATPQVTGPIVLVQDNKKTPGFLFYIPFYSTIDPPQTIKERREKIVGAVYAPFIFDKLIKGTLREEARSVSIRISDGEEVLYSEIENFASEPSFSLSKTVNIYGREWSFDIVTNDKFLVYSTTKKPIYVLLIGLLIEALIITIFLILARSNRRALSFAHKMTESYRRKTIQLKIANEELEEFAYRTSHDLRSPVISTQRLIGMVIEDLDNYTSKKDVIQQCLSHAFASMQKLDDLIQDIAAVTKATYTNEEDAFVKVSDEINAALESIKNLENYERINIQNEIPDSLELKVKQTAFQTVVNNLISNAVKYQDERKAHSYLKIYIEEEADSLLVHFEDNGVGIPKDQQENVFEMFKRFHPKHSFGSGLGLYIVQKSCRKMNATTNFQDIEEGSIFTITFKKTAKKPIL